MRRTACEKCIGEEAILCDDVCMRQARNRTNVGKYIGSERFCRARCYFPSRTDDAPHKRFVALVDDTVCSEGIGLDRLCACLQVLRMNSPDNGRCLYIGELNTFPVGMRLLGIVCAHAAVKDQRLFFDVFSYICAVLRHLYSASLPRYPSTRRAISTMLRASPA